MDPLSVTASIFGIVGFTFKALETIKNLQDFCKDFSEEATKSFLHQLQLTADLLTDTKVLSEKAKGLSATLQIDYRANSLSILVDDCSQDLETWLSIAKQVRHEHRYVIKKKSIKLLFFNSVLTAMSKHSRCSALERLRWHQENIKTMLSIFGRHVDIANVTKLDALDGSVQNISIKLSESAEMMSDQLSSISSRANSLQAQNSDLSQKMENITNMLYEAMSASSSSSSINSVFCSSRNHRVLSRELDSEPKQGRGEYSIASMSMRKDKGTWLVQPKGSLDPTLEYPEAELDFATLYRSTSALVKSLRRIYPPNIAEFVSTKHAWDTINLHLRCLHSHPGASSRNGSFDIAGKIEKISELRRTAASQLVSIQKSCKREGVDDILGKVTADIGVTNHDFKLWEVIATARSRDQKARHLEDLYSVDRDEQQKDRLSRTNEWMLGVLNAHPSLYQVHRRIVESEQPQLAWETNDVESATWRRSILKFWFLDSAAISQEDYAASQTSNLDLGATYREQLEPDKGLVVWPSQYQYLFSERVPKDEDDKREEVEYHSEALHLSSTGWTRFFNQTNLDKAASTATRAEGANYYRPDLPPDNVAPRAAKAAAQALKEIVMRNNRDKKKFGRPRHL